MCLGRTEIKIVSKNIQIQIKTSNSISKSSSVIHRKRKIAMEATLLESRLNSILEKEGFGVKSKTNKNSNINSYSTANGIFVSHYYIVLELENEEQSDNNKQTQ
jgi:hypothetical protein